MTTLFSLMQQAKQGKAVGIYSVCSAHPLVLQAAILRAKRDKSLLLIEATANQVNQFGGYTGQTPADFIANVRQLARQLGLPLSQLVFGGDHLGPVCWRNEPAAAAMQKSEDLIAAYVQAGFSKIHLDTSMPCADDPAVLSEQTIANRAARLCAVAERYARAEQPLSYVIGTEVPAPGGVQQLEQQLHATAVSSVELTLQTHQHAFAAEGLAADVWQKVLAVVVQPGVEFDNSQVHKFDVSAASGLSAFIRQHAQVVFEAHSTDYQTTQALQQLVQGQFAILKVGPELTFALREALFALSHIEAELLPVAARANLIATCREVMLRKPAYWQSFYPQADWQLLYSYSDRVRYYWPEPQLQQAVTQLLANLPNALPLPLLLQYLPEAYQAVQQGLIRNDAQSVLLFHIDQVLARYAKACGLTPIEGAH
ncbi:D-tagatose-1,6-bisphosphate aldolase subunit KbaZ [Alishewanella longhuensis]|uniref:D-tagatose-1,6-bisphosphate aldolase subunit KbaZ n=1 Tax=Alishewanella longhuensis TaxID=1091037 RepID=A0ABQ3L8G0_9ALTE|nr:class II D-tagatose-bisphosphate aldolase, non-catalytic subunit [Alishewanella longhuensis]GHG72371.1 D-tagatose-1,6-bisphosphate aldolase subunit KbaZ [Alishewanella longhuensis]